MSYHIIDISTAGASISVKDEQLVCVDKEGSAHKLPMEDVSAVLINSFSASLHNSFIISAALHRVAVIICQSFRPVSLLLPVQRSSDTLMTRTQVSAPSELLQLLWQKTVAAKCLNQYGLAAELSPTDEKRLMDFRITMNRQDSGVEANCSRLYWRLYAGALGLEKFRRDREEPGLNGLLNYGYAVLMLRVEQKLLAMGLDPMYGMGHAIRERSLPLAYDMMEPFRPVVDAMIFEWVRGRLDGGIAVDKPYKKFIQGIMARRYPYERARRLPLDEIISAVIRSFVLALRTGDARHYKPWILRNSKWVG